MPPSWLEMQASSTRLRRRIFDLLRGAVVLAWLVVLGARLAGGSGEPVERGPGSSGEAGLREGDEWHGLYLAGRSAGYLHLGKRRRSHDRGWEVRSEMQLKLLVLGQQHELRVELDAELDAALAVESFRFRMEGGQAGTLEVRGEVTGSRVELVFESAGESHRQTVQLERPPFLELVARPLMAKDGLAVGRKFSVEFFDPLSQSSRRLDAEVIAQEELVVLGEPVPCFVLQQELDRVPLKAWVTRSGEVVKEELPLGLIARRETEEEARYGRWSSPRRRISPDARTTEIERDLVVASSVAARGDLGLLSGSTVTLRLAGMDPDQLRAQRLYVHGDRQTLRGDRVTIVMEELKTRPASAATGAGNQGAASAEISTCLQPEPLIQSDHQEVRERARLLTRGASSSLDAARRINEWVHERLDKTSVIGVPSALEILRRLRGDCNEHATLFVALARAAGLPARMLAGLVFMPERNRFFYHAWSQVWLKACFESGSGWVEVDPTFGELPASSARIRLVHGGLSSQVEIFRFMGQLRAIEVLPTPDEAGPGAAAPTPDEAGPGAAAPTPEGAGREAAAPMVSDKDEAVP